MGFEPTIAARVASTETGRISAGLTLRLAALAGLAAGFAAPPDLAALAAGFAAFAGLAALDEVVALEGFADLEFLGMRRDVGKIPRACREGKSLLSQENERFPFGGGAGAPSRRNPWAVFV